MRGGARRERVARFKIKKEPSAVAVGSLYYSLDSREELEALEGKDLG